MGARVYIRRSLFSEKKSNQERYGVILVSSLPPFQTFDPCLVNILDANKCRYLGKP